ncbi:MAG: hypothetical protein OEU50_15335 [Gammaproteobacteria bacterium]|nr:hypothetical protein [Gammaproteobacteria bacterium]
MTTLLLLLGGCGGDDSTPPPPAVDIGAGFNKARGPDDSVLAIAAASDGSGDIYVGGSFTSYNGSTANRLARLNADGSIDAGFATGSGFDGIVYAIAVASDGSGDVYVGGVFSDYDGNPASNLVRLNADGSIDAAFSTGSGFNSIVYAIMVASDGSGDIYVGGAFSAPGNGLVRINADGSVDAGFATGTSFNNSVFTLAPATGGDIYVGGGFTAYNGSTAIRLVRLNADGSIHTAFATGTGFNGSVRAIVRASDGSGDIFVGGSFTAYDVSTVNRLVRLDTDGSIDTVFASVTGTGFDRAVLAMAPAIDGSRSVYVGGNFTNYDGDAAPRLVRLLADGSIDISFATGMSFNGQVNVVAAVTDGSGDIYAGGHFTTYDGNGVKHLVRLNIDAGIDTGFAVGSGFDRSVEAIAAANDGSGDVFVGGNFDLYDGSRASGLVRLDADGSMDPAFVTGFGFNHVVGTIAATTDGSGDVYIGGFFTAYNGSTAGRLVRLNADGSIDVAFATGTGFDGRVSAIAVAPDGSGDVYVGGNFTAYNGSISNGVIRLNADGSIDTAFAIGSGFDDTVSAIAAATDGSGDVYVGGNFTTYNGSAAYRLLRLNADGSIDGAFATGTGSNNIVFAIAPTSDGSGDIYVGGRLTSYNGSAVNRLLRLDPGGSIDAAFATGTGFNNAVTAVAVSADGSGDVYIGGHFTDYNGSAATRITRLDADGSIDTAFATGTSFNNSVFAIAAATDGSGDVFSGGSFTSYDMTAVDRIARLDRDGTVD